MKRNRVAHDDYYGAKSSGKRDGTGRWKTVAMVVTCILLILGTVCVGVGVGLPVWLSVSGSNSGVFQTCTDNLSGCTSLLDYIAFLRFPNGVYLVPLLWGLVIAGCTCLFFAYFCLCGYQLHRKVNHCKIALAIFFGVLLVLAFACLLAGMVVFMDYFSANLTSIQYVGYAFYIAAAGVLFLLLTLFVFMCHTFFLYKEHRGISHY